MAFPMFENGVYDAVSASPNDMYRALEQAFIDEQWDNTSAKTPENGGAVLEQQGIGSSEYTEIEVWVKPAVADVTTGQKDSFDFLKLLFKDITHVVPRGQYYQFADNYWIAHSTNPYNGLPRDVGIRRCNNFLRIVDPENGSIFSIPCVIDYDMSSPSMQMTSYVLTPNNHAVVQVQGNDTTNRLFTVNKRFILNGRPFKLYGIQNAINDDVSSPLATLLYIDMYLDEKHDEDNFTTGVADNGTYDYVVSINSDNMELTQGSTGTLTADITLNGVETSGTVLWSSSNTDVVTIDDTGVYSVVGVVGESTIITATLEGNAGVVSEIVITVTDVSSLQARIVVNPLFDKIRQYETITFDIQAFYGSQEYAPDTVTISLADGSVVLSNAYVSIVQNGAQYAMTCNKITSVPQFLYITVANTTPAFSVNTAVQFSTVSMMG